MYEKQKYKNAYCNSIGEQDLFNDFAFGKITYFPFKFGMIYPYLIDNNSEKEKKIIYIYFMLKNLDIKEYLILFQKMKKIF